jgi:hypothetical protein
MVGIIAATVAYRDLAGSTAAWVKITRLLSEKVEIVFMELRNVMDDGQRNRVSNTVPDDHITGDHRGAVST